VADVEVTAVADPELPPPPPRRRLWERFSLTVLAFMLLMLAQSAFGILIREYGSTFRIAPGSVTAFLVFAVLAGFAAGMAVVLPQRVVLRHPGRGITLALLPLVVTALNLLATIAPASLPGPVGTFAATYLIGIQPVASLLVGVAAASAFADY
jgi:hypothetical protein